MKKGIKAASAFIAAAISVSVGVPASAAEDYQKLLSDMKASRSRAESYEINGNYGMAFEELCEYAEICSVLADAGEISAADADIAEGWRDSLKFTPELYISDSSKKGVFFGGDGKYIDGASAVKLSIPFGAADVSGYTSMIPPCSEELGILVSFDIWGGESMLRSIAFGGQDEYLIESLRVISRMEGRIYLSFCPSINTWKSTRTVAQSFINAYRYVADFVRRYAPNVSMVFTLGDVLDPGEDTVLKFYPGDGYVDVFGVELCHTYNKSEDPSAKAAYDCRGSYYDPVFSAARMTEAFAEVAGRADTPVIIESCSFPWEGTAAVEDWAFEMERFYNLIPAVCPTLEAVFYSNESSSAGVCNLRQNSEAEELYEKCLSLPWYVNYSSDAANCGAVSIEKVSYIAPGETAYMVLYCGGKFDGTEYRIFLDGTEIGSDGAVISPGERNIIAYVTDNKYTAVLEYNVSFADDGTFTAKAVPAQLYDYNGNGILDFGDSELLLAYIAEWDVYLNGFDPDVDGDGKVNISDVKALNLKMIPPR